MKYRLLILPLVALSAIVAACADSQSSASRPTEYLILTGNSDIVQITSPTPVQLITQAVTAPAPFPTASPAASATTQLHGVVVNGEAVLLADAKIDAEELSTIPEGAIVPVLAQTEPDRIGIVFYEVTYGGETGWVASTRFQLLEDSVPTTPLAFASQTPLSTPTVFPSATPLITSTPTITPTALPPGFPTPEVYSVVLVEQIFEHGRMIWFQPIRQIWVLVGSDVDPTGGTWQCFLDEYVDGQPERDPTLDPSSGVTTQSQFEGAAPQQPIRGFGRVWRENATMRQELGWALAPETLHTTRYEYIAGGEMKNGQYVAAPGEYRVESLYQYTLVFKEDTVRAPCETKTGTWEIQ